MWLNQFVGLLAMGTGTIYGALTGSWELIMLHSLVQPEYRRKCLVLIKLDTLALLIPMGGLWLFFWRKTRLRGEWRKMGVMSWKRGGREGWDLM